MNGYSMPRYFQNMPQIGKALNTENLDNREKIEQIEEAIYQMICDAQDNGRSTESLNAAGQLTALQRIEALIDEDTCIYLDCSSNINTSKPKTISKINLLENEDFSNYKCYFISEKRLKDKNVYTLMEGESLKSNSKIKLYLTYE